MADSARSAHDVDAVREAADYWVRSSYTEAGRAIHIPADESSRDEPETPCRHAPRAGRWRTVEPDHFDDELLEERLCDECAAVALGEDYRPGGDDVDYSRTPLDRLAAAGLLDEDEDDDDDRLRADGGRAESLGGVQPLEGACPTCDGSAEIYPSPRENGRGHVYCNEDDCGWIHRDLPGVGRYTSSDVGAASEQLRADGGTVGSPDEHDGDDTAMSEDTTAVRQVRGEPYGYDRLEGYTMTVTLTELKDTRHGQRPVETETVGQYVFQRADRDHVGDRVRGELPDVGRPLIYIGSSTGKYYYRSHDLDEVPVDVLEELGSKDVVLLDGVDGGWASWGGRPEFDDSVTYIDYSECEVVDLESLIVERRSEQCGVSCTECEHGRVVVADAIYAECENCDAEFERNEVGL